MQKSNLEESIASLMLIFGAEVILLELCRHQPPAWCFRWGQELIRQGMLRSGVAELEEAAVLGREWSEEPC